MRNAPYIMALRVAEPFAPYTFSNDLTYELHVSQVTGIAVIANTIIKNVFPNPNNGDFTLEIHSSVSGNTDIIISNMMGQQVHRVRNIQMYEGFNAVQLTNASLSEGHYVVRVVREGKTLAVKNLEIIRLNFLNL